MEKTKTKKELREQILKEKLNLLSDKEKKLYFLKKEVGEYNKRHGFKKNNGYKINPL